VQGIETCNEEKHKEFLRKALLHLQPLMFRHVSRALQQGKRGKRILSLDGGGVKGIVSIMALHRLQSYCSRNVGFAFVFLFQLYGNVH